MRRCRCGSSECRDARRAAEGAQAAAGGGGGDARGRTRGRDARAGRLRAPHLLVGARPLTAPFGPPPRTAVAPRGARTLGCHRGAGECVGREGPLRLLGPSSAATGEERWGEKSQSRKDGTGGPRGLATHAHTHTRARPKMRTWPGARSPTFTIYRAPDRSGHTRRPAVRPMAAREGGIPEPAGAGAGPGTKEPPGRAGLPRGAGAQSRAKGAAGSAQPPPTPASPCWAQTHPASEMGVEGGGGLLWSRSPRPSPPPHTHPHGQVALRRA